MIFLIGRGVSFEFERDFDIYFTFCLLKGRRRARESERERERETRAHPRFALFYYPSWNAQISVWVSPL